MLAAGDAPARRGFSLCELRHEQPQDAGLRPGCANGLNRAIERAESTAAPVEYDSALAFGDVYALHELWVSLGFRDVVRTAL